MVLFSIHIRPFETTLDIKSQISGSGINAQHIRLKSYAVYLKNDNAGAVIPHALYVSLDFLGNQIHNGMASKTDGGDDYQHSNALILPLSHELQTIVSGLDIEFLTSGKVDRNITASVRRYDTNNNLIEMEAKTSAIAVDDTVTYLSGIYLFFEYDKKGNF
jgi:hypothetical protein|tara:strand:+ start:8384 stop:8866 length:483 start_codon:yes stop_codon:yes gene_type:complete